MKQVRMVRKFRYKMFLSFILFAIVLSLVVDPIIIFYGPFTNIKKSIVGASMSSYKHQYIAKFFLNDDQITKILSNSTSSNSNIKIDDESSISDIDTSNKNDNIELVKIEGMKFDGYMLIIHDPKRVHIGVTNKLGIQGEKTSQIAKSYNAIGAINGGGFTDKTSHSNAVWTGTGAFPEGPVMIDSNLIYPTDSFDKNKKYSGIVGISKSGVLVIGNNSINTLLKNNVRDALVFGPPLIINGKINSNISSQGVAPRTAIGQRKDGSIIFLVADGRAAIKVGATITEIQTLMYKQKAYNAINLDGGASTTLYYKGDVVNSPSDKFGERTIPTIFYVK